MMLKKDSVVKLLAYDGDFALVDYKGVRGYVEQSCLKPIE